MGTEKRYPTKIHLVVHELLFVIEKDKPKVDWPISEAARGKMTALIFCFMAQETKKLRKKINQLEAAQLPLDRQGPATPLDNHHADPRADRHVD